MKVVILAGGFGTRISEFTDVIPKPMIPIGGKPIIWHIMNYYASFGFNDFIVALGYKSEAVKEYFLNFRTLNADFKIDLSTGNIDIINSCKSKIDWKLTLVETGINTMTGGRLLRLKKFIGDQTFMLTYGDGLSDVNITKLLEFHKLHKKLVTLTAVRPNARFGEVKINKGEVVSFFEKPQLQQGWINGGFFVISPKFLDLIDDDETMLEREPLERATDTNQLMAFQHEGFWQCMDTKRDHELLKKLWHKGAPWVKKFEK